MRLFSNHPLFSDEMVRTICWTLVHSLWQGLLLAVLAALVLLLTKKMTAVVRYQVLGFLLLLFIGGVGLTFGLQWRHEVAQLAQEKPLIFIDSNLLITATDAVVEEKPVFGILNRRHLDAAVRFLNAHASSISLFWALVFLLKCLKMGLDLYLIRRLRYRGAVAPAQEWQDRVTALAGKLGLQTQLTLLESTLVQVPSVIGTLKPVILVPLGMMAQLPAEQVEAILLHELAHIRRRDFLVNLLQHFTETVFFFNPAVLWVSTLLREEREHCCDELAVAAMERKSGYLNALLRFEELNAARINLAAAFPGTHRGQLLERVRRILGHGNIKTLNNMEKITLIACVFMAGLFWMMPLDDVQAQTKKTEKQNFSSISIMGEGTNVDPQYMTLKEHNGKTYTLKRVDKKVQEMAIDGQKVPDGEIANYADMIKKVDEQIERDREQAERDREQAGRDREQAERDREQAERDREQAMRDMEQAKLDREQGERDREQAERDREQAKKDQEQAKRDWEQGERDRAQGELDRQQAERDREQAKKDQEQAMRDREQAERDRAQAIRDREQAERDRAQAVLDRRQAERDREQAKKDQEVVNKIINDLVQDGLVPNRNSLTSFQFSNRVLKVNGKKVSDEIHSKYKAKYLTSPGDYEIQYSNSGRVSVGSTQE